MTLRLSLLLLATCGVLCILTTLPQIVNCDTSYYEKYYSARRFQPVKHPVPIKCNFMVRCDDISPNLESVAIIGDHEKMGKWLASDAILMNRTQDKDVWKAVVYLPANITIQYRYFIAVATEDSQITQIRRWESSMWPRNLSVPAVNNDAKQIDLFGEISSPQKELQSGWLHSGYIIQFKLFGSALHMHSTINSDEQVHLKLEPIDPRDLTPILPSPRAFMQYVRMEYSNCFIRPQTEFGVRYEDNDKLIFQMLLSNLKDVAYLIKVYGIKHLTKSVRLIGHQYIQPEIVHGSYGDFTIDIMSPVWLNVIGTLNLKYLLIKPLENSNVNFRTSFMNFWRDNWTNLDVGHRGLGNSLKFISNGPPSAENTIGAMNAAAEMGADMVEFDIQLTSDLVPIVYHDYSIYVCMESKTPKSRTDLTEVLIKDITYEQLKNLKTYQIVGNKIIEYASHNTVENEDDRLFPTFADFLIKVDKRIGFDIEIKWPQLRSNGTYQSIQTIDKNVYADRIINVMLQHGCGRVSFFSSFDADLCALLRYKQNMYPVMFLSPSRENYFADPRSDTIFDVVDNSQAFDLSGIVINVNSLFNNSKSIEVGLAQGLKVFVWGEAIKDADALTKVKSMIPQAHGIIYDRLDLLVAANKTGIFDTEVILLQWQCDDRNSISNGSTTVDNTLANVNLL